MNRDNKQIRRRRPLCTLLAVAILAAAGYIAASFAVRTVFPLRYNEIISASCEEFGVSESLAVAVIHTESGFDPTARSQVGAIGLMQIMPDTFEWLQTKLPPPERLSQESLYDPYINIRYGVFFLSILDEQFGDDVLVIAAYHAGQGKVAQWLEAELIPAKGCTAVDIPSAVTGHYVTKVERSRRIYRRLYSIDR